MSGLASLGLFHIFQWRLKHLLHWSALAKLCTIDCTGFEQKNNSRNESCCTISTSVFQASKKKYTQKSPTFVKKGDKKDRQNLLAEDTQHFPGEAQARPENCPRNKPRPGQGLLDDGRRKQRRARDRNLEVLYSSLKNIIRSGQTPQRCRLLLVTKVPSAAMGPKWSWIVCPPNKQTGMAN